MAEGQGVIANENMSAVFRKLGFDVLNFGKGGLEHYHNLQPLRNMQYIINLRLFYGFFLEMMLMT